jgi:hypothetical protein
MRRARRRLVTKRTPRVGELKLLCEGEAMETVSLVIKNADGITPDTSLEEMPIDYSTVGDVKTRLREIIGGGPEESRMKLVFSGRFGCPPLPREEP